MAEWLRAWDTLTMFEATVRGMKNCHSGHYFYYFKIHRTSSSRMLWKSSVVMRTFAGWTKLRISYLSGSFDTCASHNPDRRTGFYCKPHRCCSKINAMFHINYLSG